MSYIWVPKVKIIEPPPLQSVVGLSGKFGIKKYKLGFKEPVQVVEPFSNLITDWGLDMLAGGTWFQYMALGTGTATPAATDLQLQTLAGFSATTVGGGSGPAPTAPDYNFYVFNAHRFNPGVASGNLTEVGIVNNNNASTYRCFSRALIVDGTGAPLTITLQPDEYLDVTYYLGFYRPELTLKSDTVNIAGVDYTFAHKLAFATRAVTWTSINGNFNWSGNRTTWFTGSAAGTPPALGDITSGLSNTGGSTGSSAPVFASYVAGSHSLNMTESLSLAQGNLQYGLRGFSYLQPWSGSTEMYDLQGTITPAIPKDSTKLFSWSYSTSWARH